MAKSPQYPIQATPKSKAKAATVPPIHEAKTTIEIDRASRKLTCDDGQRAQARAVHRARIAGKPYVEIRSEVLWLMNQSHAPQLTDMATSLIVGRLLVLDMGKNKQPIAVAAHGHAFSATPAPDQLTPGFAYEFFAPTRNVVQLAYARDLGKNDPVAKAVPKLFAAALAFNLLRYEDGTPYDALVGHPYATSVEDSRRRESTTTLTILHADEDGTVTDGAPNFMVDRMQLTWLSANRTQKPLYYLHPAPIIESCTAEKSSINSTIALAWPELHLVSLLSGVGHNPDKVTLPAIALARQSD